MNRNEFADAIVELTETFRPPDLVERVNALFRKFHRQKAHVLKRAAEIAADELDRFPSRARFLTYIAKAHQSLQQETGGGSGKVRAECHFCDGFGFVLSRDGAYRGRCEHGDELSRRIPVAPENLSVSTPRIGRERDAVELAGTISNPVAWIKGVWAFHGVPSEARLTEPPPVLVGRIAEVYPIIADVIGEERLRKIRLEYLERRNVQTVSAMRRTITAPTGGPGSGRRERSLRPNETRKA